MLDLRPATRTLSDLVTNVPADLLDGATPCPDYSLGDLVDHVDGLALAFAAAAGKDASGITNAAPLPDASRLAADWRDRVPTRLDALADAWRDPAAWTGMTRVGGVDLPGEVAGLVALDEVVVHGWDVAVASGQPFRCDPHLLEAVHDFLAQSVAAGEPRDGVFGPVVPVPDDAPLLDRVLGLAGRDPAWRAQPAPGVPSPA